MSLIGLQDVNISFGGFPLLDAVNMQIQPGERVCLLGRNGTGKTTLLKIITGDIEPDNGTVARRQGLTATLLTQEIPRDFEGSVYDVVLGGLGEPGKLHSQYHHIAVQLAEKNTETLMKQLDQLHKQLDATNGWEIHRQADTVITRMKLPPEDIFTQLSEGMKRRVLLARALVRHPDLLVLDEPTNHLDIEAITWLEEFLLKYETTLLFVTHDRELVKKLSTRIVELDRGRLFNWDCSYLQYLDRKAEFLEAERKQRGVFDKKLAQEEVWIRQGIKARRTRNEGRVTALLKMREERRVRREQMGSANLNLQNAGLSGKLVAEVKGISFGYDNEPVVKDFSTLIMRGDRVGVIGPNGSGKTTLLRLLLGQLTPQTGNIRLGANLEPVYFDQLRDQLDDEKTVVENVADGNDLLLIDGKNRHVISYVQEFLFTPDRARTAVKVLSGGERNRLLLAKLFARPSNLLVMDEPTNDLDIETLELLEEVLLSYRGTLLLVSHDRAFLNNVVTSTLALEGGGTVNDYVGGYDDWLMQRPSTSTGSTGRDEKKSTQPSKKTTPRQRSQKLSNKERQELESLPADIETMEAELEELYQTMSAPDFYKQEAQQVSSATARLEKLKDQLAQAYQRWEELEELKMQYEAKKIDF